MTAGGGFGGETVVFVSALVMILFLASATSARTMPFKPFLCDLDTPVRYWPLTYGEGRVDHVSATARVRGHEVCPLDVAHRWHFGSLAAFDICILLPEHAEYDASLGAFLRILSYRTADDPTDGFDGLLRLPIGWRGGGQTVALTCRR
ncbi:MAG: hypothetical protein AAF919_04555 [Pseudomonadota bacterium]